MCFFFNRKFVREHQGNTFFHKLFINKYLENLVKCNLSIQKKNNNNTLQKDKLILIVLIRFGLVDFKYVIGNTKNGQKLPFLTLAAKKYFLNTSGELIFFKRY